jgi:hypothetical protein
VGHCWACSISHTTIDVSTLLDSCDLIAIAVLKLGSTSSRCCVYWYVAAMYFNAMRSSSWCCCSRTARLLTLHCVHLGLLLAVLSVKEDSTTLLRLCYRDHLLLLETAPAVAADAVRTAAAASTAQLSVLLWPVIVHY